jgi:protein tyrosine phosphatase
LKNAFTESLTLKTTLYDVIESIYEELKEDEEDDIVQIVLHMLKSTRAKFVSDVEKFKKFRHDR